MHLLPPLPDYWYTSFFFLAVTGHLHETAVSAFSRSLLGGANTFLFPSLRLIPRKPKGFSDFTLFLSASLPLLSILSSTVLLRCTSQTSLRTSSLLGLLIYHSILSQLRFPTLFQLALLVFSPIQLYQLWLALFWLVPHFINVAISNLSCICLS